MTRTHSPQPTILIIIGITGDLAQRKLLPALEAIAAAGELPEAFRLVGVSRREVKPEDVVDARHTFVRQHLEMLQMDLDDPVAYTRLVERLAALDAEMGVVAQKVLYLSVPPISCWPIIEHLGMSGISKDANTKLLLEKPFGIDLASAQELIDHTRSHFSEQQIYRIDHYLAKEMAQNLLIFRADNALFRRTWNRDFIESIEIVASEEIGIEGRSAFYEQTGALRDILQNHLLQLAALTLMELPDRLDSGAWDDVPAARLRALQQLHLPEGDVHAHVRRAQYDHYAQEVDNPESRVETFVSATFVSDDPVWRDVPITVTTGKALDRKTTEIRIHYHKDESHQANTLILRIQPAEGIELNLWSKRPGYGHELDKVLLSFEYHKQADSLPEAYEQVLISAIDADHMLFTSGDEVLASWKIVQAIQQAWAEADGALSTYAAGTSPADIS